MTYISSFDAAPADFPNHLAGPQPEQIAYEPRYRLLLALVLLCLVPRAIVAVFIPCIAGDGVNYVNAAQALEAGNYRDALWEGGINIYPVLLTVFHRLGIDWETAAITWGVVISSLVVLPLWGWIRRQFDDRVALVACLLYIVHPKFITESPELMRDPTFWFFFTFAIYAMWRAVTEVRYGYFVATGAAITLAALTRIEGILLLIPLFVWAFWRVLALKTARRKLVFGMILCLSVFPLLILAVNLVWLSGHSDWAMIRVSPLERIRPCIESLFGGKAPEVTDATVAPPRIGRIIWRFFPTMTRGLSPVFALLMFGGIWGWRRTWSRRDHQALFLTSMAAICGILIQSWSNWYLQGNINARYALPIALMASPFAALGLMALTARIRTFIENRGWQPNGFRSATAAASFLVLLPGAVDVSHNVLTNYDIRHTANAVGHWLKHEYSSPPMILAPWDIVRPVSFYAGNKTYASFRYDDADDYIVDSARQSNADVVVLQSLGVMTPQRCDSLADQLMELGFKAIERDSLACVGPNCRVLVRADRLDVTRRPISRR